MKPIEKSKFFVLFLQFQTVLFLFSFIQLHFN